MVESCGSESKKDIKWFNHLNKLYKLVTTQPRFHDTPAQWNGSTKLDEGRCHGKDDFYVT